MELARATAATADRRAVIIQQLSRLSALGFRLFNAMDSREVKSQKTDQWVDAIDRTHCTIADMQQAITSMESRPIDYPTMPHLLEAIDHVRRERVDREQQAAERERKRNSRLGPARLSLARDGIRRWVADRVEGDTEMAAIEIALATKLGVSLDLAQHPPAMDDQARAEAERQAEQEHALANEKCGLCHGYGLLGAEVIEGCERDTDGGEPLLPGTSFGVCCSCTKGRSIQELQKEPRGKDGKHLATAHPMPVFDPSTMRVSTVSF